jgi:lipid II:glycine glycyltransferase (peptidoglycan interpeptide bridge formation enzyme)
MATREHSSSTHRVDYVDDTPPVDWDMCVAGVPQGHPEQSSGWAAAERVYGWDVSWVVMRNEGAIVAGAQVLHRPLHHLGRIAYVRCGPVFDEESAALRVELFDHLNRWARRRRVRYLVVNPGKADAACETALYRAGFVPKPAALNPRILSTATLFIDLDAPLEEIMAKVRRDKRRQIRGFATSGLTLREGTADDLEMFYELLKMTTARLHCSPNPSRFDYLQNLWAALRPLGHVRMFVVELDGTPVSAAINLPFADTVRCWRYGWNGMHSDLAPNVFLHWKAIEWAKSEGYRYVDIVQVDGDLADRIKRKDPLTPADRANRLFGPTMFKTGFGGEVVRLPGPFCRFYPSWINGIFRGISKL